MPKLTSFLGRLPLVLPALFVAAWWHFGETLPRLDSAYYYNLSKTLSQSFLIGGISGFLTEFSHSYKPLLNSLLGAAVLSLFDGTYRGVLGIVNTSLVLILTSAIYLSFRIVLSGLVRHRVGDNLSQQSVRILA